MAPPSTGPTLCDRVCGDLDVARRIDIVSHHHFNTTRDVLIRLVSMLTKMARSLRRSGNGNGNGDGNPCPPGYIFWPKLNACWRAGEPAPIPAPGRPSLGEPCPPGSVFVGPESYCWRPGQPATPPALTTPEPPPECPPGYYYDFSTAACWRDGTRPPRHPDSDDPPLYEDRCSPGFVWVMPEEYCWNPLTPGGPTLGGHCGPGAVWDEQLQRCRTRKCPPDQVWDEQLQACSVQSDPRCWAPLDRLRWKQLPTDCKGSKGDKVRDAMIWAFKRLYSARSYMRRLMDSSFDDAQELWRAEPGQWFGPYDFHVVALVRDALEGAYERMTGGDVLVRCQEGCTHTRGWFAWDVMHLCKRWLNDDDADDRGETLLHEMFHYLFPGIYPNTPRDVRECYHLCGDLETIEEILECDGKCYNAPGARYLRDNLGITRTIGFPGGWWITVPAAAVNVDSYVEWLKSLYLRCR